MPTDLTYPPTQLQPVEPVTAGGESPAAVAAPPALAAAPDTDRGRRTDSTADLLVRVAAAAAAPAAGTRCGEFLLLEEIGRGTFSRVFLAQQPALGDRTVVVKVTASARQEANCLSRLQHPNIMPIHSVHAAGGRQVVCMPYLGTATLADAYRAIENMPSLPDSGRGLFTTLTTRQAATLPPGQPTPSPRPTEAAPVLASLAGRSYVDAVLWLASQLADALAHAHDAGIVHRDLKPANVLLADDGRPVLLDFNLATPATAAADETRGGTPQYMSPEQLHTFAGRPRPVDGRADLYALGLMLFELLTRRSPFPRRRATPETLPDMLTERAGPAPSLAEWNRAVSPAVEAVVRRCLAPDPADRYQSAHELKADLDRHLADRPLVHTAEPSRRERAAKCWRRNRELGLAVGLAVVMTAAAGLTLAATRRTDGRLARHEATAVAAAFVADVQAAEVLMLNPADPAHQDDGVRAGEVALGRFDVTGADWWAAAELEALPEPARLDLRERAGELLVTLGRAVSQRAVREAATADPTPALRRAYELNAAALACYPERQAPQGAWEQRAELARLLGRTDEVRECSRHVGECPADSPAGRRLRAYRYLAAGQYAAARPLLEELARGTPHDYVLWYTLGVCNLEDGRPAAAAGQFNTCVALRPDCPWGWQQLGRALARAGDADAAQVACGRFRDLHSAGVCGEPDGHTTR